MTVVRCPGGGKPGICSARAGRDRCTVCNYPVKAVSDGTIRRHALTTKQAAALAWQTLVPVADRKAA